MSKEPRVRRVLGLGFALLPVVGAVVPFSVGTGTGSGLVAALLLTFGLLGVWVLDTVVSKQVLLRRTPVNLPVMAVAILWILSTVSSNVYFDPRVAVALGTAFTFVQMGALGVTLASLGLLMLGANIGTDARYAHLATWTLLVVGGVAVAAYFLKVEHRLTWLNANGLFTLWVISLAYGQALFNDRLPPVVRMGLLALVGAFLAKAVVYQVGWLSGWIPSLAAVALLTLLRSRALFVVGMVVALAAAFAFQDRIYEAVFQSQLDEGSDSRLDIWLQAWDLLSQHPLLGTGPAGYAAYYMTLYVGLGTSLSTHSNYIDIAAQTGLVGFVVFLWLLSALAVVAFQACRRWRDGFEGAFVRAAAAGLVGALIAMALGDWVIPFVYNQTIQGFRYTVHTWIFLGLMAGLATCPMRQTER